MSNIGALIMRLKLILISLSSLSAFAQTKITVDEAIQIGLKNSKSLHASAMNTDYNESKRSEAKTQMLPSLRFNGTYTRLSSIPAGQFMIPANSFAPGVPQADVVSTLSPALQNNYVTRFTAQQMLFSGFRVENSIRVANYNAKAAQEQYSSTKKDLIYNVKNAYWNLFKAQQISKMVDENVEQIKAHLKDAQNLFANGMITTNDVLKVEVQLSTAELAQIDAKNAVQLSMIALNNVMGLPLETQIELSSQIEYKPKDAGELKPILETAMQNHADVKAMQYRVKAGQAGVSLARGGWYPTIALVGNYNYNRPNTRYFPTKDKFRDTWDVSVNVSFDIWNWGTAAKQTDQAQSQLAQAEDALGQLKDGITLDVTQSYLNVQQAKDRIAVAEKSVKLAEENYRITSQRFKSGVALNSDLLDAEVALLQAKTNYTQTLVDYELAQAKLQKSVGNE